jgi:hypothetical protein
MEEPRSVRVMLRNGDEHTFPNAEYQVDHRTKWLIVYWRVGEEREDVAQFDLNTVRHYEYVVEE